MWDSSIVMSKYVEKEAETLVQGKRCLDLSAGCGLVGKRGLSDSLSLSLSLRVWVCSCLHGRLQDCGSMEPP